MPLKGKLFDNPEEAVLFPSKRKDSRTVPYLGRREKKKTSVVHAGYAQQHTMLLESWFLCTLNPQALAPYHSFNLLPTRADLDSKCSLLFKRLC